MDSLRHDAKLNAGSNAILSKIPLADLQSDAVKIPQVKGAVAFDTVTANFGFYDGTKWVFMQPFGGNSVGTPGVYGPAQITINTAGQISNVTLATNINATSIQGNPISPLPPGAPGDVLTWNGSLWGPAPVLFPTPTVGNVKFDYPTLVGPPTDNWNIYGTVGNITSNPSANFSVRWLTISGKSMVNINISVTFQNTVSGGTANADLEIVDEINLSGAPMFLSSEDLPGGAPGMWPRDGYYGVMTSDFGAFNNLIPCQMISPTVFQMPFDAPLGVFYTGSVNFDYTA